MAGEEAGRARPRFNDHVTSFFFYQYSAFALGIGDSYAVVDEGGGPRNLLPLRGHTGLGLRWWRDQNLIEEFAPPGPITRSLQIWPSGKLDNKVRPWIIS